MADLSDRLAKAQKEKEFLQQELRDARSSLRDADARAARDATALEELLHKLRGVSDDAARTGVASGDGLLCAS